MKITKFLHSCLLIEENGKAVLIDPGSFVYEQNALSAVPITNLDYLLITHEHPDHMSIPLIKDLKNNFPNARIVSNPSIAAILEKENLTVHTDLSTLPADAGIQFEEMPHGHIFDREVPQNVLFEVFGRLTHPGDSMSFGTTKEMLALPLLGPSWMITQAAEKALELKPQVIIPIHDYHWRDNFRKEYYKRLESFFEKNHIIFKGLESGESFTI